MWLPPRGTEPQVSRFSPLSQFSAISIVLPEKVSILVNIVPSKNPRTTGLTPRGPVMALLPCKEAVGVLNVGTMWNERKRFWKREGEVVEREGSAQKNEHKWPFTPHHNPSEENLFLSWEIYLFRWRDIVWQTSDPFIKELPLDNSLLYNFLWKLSALWFGPVNFFSNFQNTWSFAEISSLLSSVIFQVQQSSEFNQFVQSMLLSNTLQRRHLKYLSKLLLCSTTCVKFRQKPGAYGCASLFSSWRIWKRVFLF